jgi:hypothetical protein
MAPLFLFLHLRVLSFETLERGQSPSLLLLLIFVPVRRQAIALPDPGQATSTQQIFCYYSADFFYDQGMIFAEFRNLEGANIWWP